MSPAPHATSAVFLVRVWMEDEVVRARIIESLDLVDRHDEAVFIVGSAAEIERRLHDWLEELARSGNAAATAALKAHASSHPSRAATPAGEQLRLSPTSADY